jgi:RNA polymerase sigma factor (sigma-70 family)
VAPARATELDTLVRLSTDEELLVAWRGGDANAGEQLFDRYFPMLTRFFRNKGEPIDDLIQATLLGLLESQHRWRADAPFRSFVFGVAYNTLRNHYRRSIADAERIDFGTSSIFDLAAGASAVLADAQEQQLILQALRRIPVEHQVLLELYFWEPLSAAEIGAVLGVPEGTVRTRIRRAKALLQAALGELHAKPGLVESTASDLEDWARSIKDAGR